MTVRLGPVARISLGLISLVAFLILTADLLVGLLPDQTEMARQVRKRTAEAFAIQLTALVQAQQYEVLRRTLHTLVTRQGELRSIGVRRENGAMVAETGNHALFWVPPADGRSTLTSVLVPISGPDGHWGQIELAYRPMTPASAVEWLKIPGVSITVLLFTAGFAMFSLYLRRVLRSLDPASAIPERVRTAFDALSEGVLVVDRNGIVLLANRAFRQLHPRADAEMTGMRIKDIDWLAGAADADAQKHPWARAMARAESVTGEFLQVASASGEKVKIAINCSPIQDGHDQVRGCLITFDDLSSVEHMNQALLDLVSRLDAANDQIQKHNEELKYLANHDQLTGALTRRAFMEQAEQIFLRSAGARSQVACVMADIDYFKSINDRYGHLVGDQAIRHVAAVLQKSVRAGDLVCRFGGEEFCILLPRASAQDAMDIAERMRSVIETGAGAAVVPGETARITCSFGVSSMSGRSVTLSEMIRQADQALYAAKAAGRNRVLHDDGSPQAGTGGTRVPRAAA